MAEALPVHRQKKLFDDTREAEKVLHYLAGLKTAELGLLVLPVLVHSAIQALQDKHGLCTLVLYAGCRWYCMQVGIVFMLVLCVVQVGIVCRLVLCVVQVGIVCRLVLCAGWYCIHVGIVCRLVLCASWYCVHVCIVCMFVLCALQSKSHAHIHGMEC